MRPTVLLGLPQLVQPGAQVRLPDGHEAVPRYREVLTVAGSGVLVQSLLRSENVGVITQPTGTGHILTFRGVVLHFCLRNLRLPAVTPLRTGASTGAPVPLTGLWPAVAGTRSATGVPVD